MNTIEIVPGISIDRLDFLDPDDAFWIYSDCENPRLQVSLANATQLIRPDSPFDRTAFDRGFSRYNRGFCDHLFPVDVTVDRISFLEGEQRPAVSLEFPINDGGGLEKPTFKESILVNRQQMSYRQADRFIEDRDNPFFDMLNRGYTLTQALHEKREGGAEFEFGVTEGGSEGDYRFKSFHMVSELMILANKELTVFCQEKGIPLIYRNHVSLSLEQQNRVLQGLFNKHRQGVDYVQLKTDLMSLSERAYYDANNSGHKGLKMPEGYAQFSSSGRRYSDFVNLRQFLSGLKGEQPVYNHEQLKDISTHLNSMADAFGYRHPVTFLPNYRSFAR